MKAEKPNPKRASKVDALPKPPTKKTVPPELNRAVTKAEAILKRLTENELGQRYALGVLVRDAMDHAKYGEAALAAFADKLHLDEDTLRAHAKVTRVWDEKKFNEQAEQRGGLEGTYRLSWSHFVLLAAVGDGRTRKGLITAAFAETLSEKALRARRAGASQPGKGRLSVVKPDAATDVDTTSDVVVVGTARDLAGTANDVADAARQLEEAGQRLSSILGEHPLDDADMSQLVTAQETLERLERLLAEARDQITRALAKSADAAEPNVEQEPAPVQFTRPTVVQEPAPFNPLPVSISRVVAESAQVQ